MHQVHFSWQAQYFGGLDKRETQKLKLIGKTSFFTFSIFMFRGTRSNREIEHVSSCMLDRSRCGMATILISLRNPVATSRNPLLVLYVCVLRRSHCGSVLMLTGFERSWRRKLFSSVENPSTLILREAHNAPLEVIV